MFGSRRWLVFLHDALLNAMKLEITQPIAMRKLSFGSEEVTVVLGMPQPVEDSDFLCPYEISYSGHTRKGYAIGVDGVQAIQLAMKKIASDLLHLSTASGIPISGKRGDPGDTGFRA
jgi:hypothetical protein